MPNLFAILKKNLLNLFGIDKFLDNISHKNIKGNSVGITRLAQKNNDEYIELEIYFTFVKNKINIIINEKVKIIFVIFRVIIITSNS